MVPAGSVLFVLPLQDARRRVSCQCETKDSVRSAVIQLWATRIARLERGAKEIPITDSDTFVADP